MRHGFMNNKAQHKISSTGILSGVKDLFLSAGRDISGQREK
jgi:hypothetical protein